MSLGAAQSFFQGERRREEGNVHPAKPVHTEVLAHPAGLFTGSLFVEEASARRTSSVFYRIHLPPLPSSSPTVRVSLTLSRRDALGEYIVCVCMHVCLSVCP